MMMFRSENVHDEGAVLSSGEMQDKIEAIAKQMYKAAGVSYTPEAEAQVSVRAMGSTPAVMQVHPALVN